MSDIDREHLTTDIIAHASDGVARAARVLDQGRGLLRHATTRICVDEAAIPDTVPVDRCDTLIVQRDDTDIASTSTSTATTKRSSSTFDRQLFWPTALADGWQGERRQGDRRQGECRHRE